MTDLPAGWSQVSLSAVADVLRGVTYKKADSVSSPTDGFVPLLRATNINRALDLDSEMVYVPERYVRPEQHVRVGDVVVAASSGSASVVGKSAAVRHAWGGAFGAFCSVIRPRTELALGYLAHLVASPAVRRLWRDLAQGTNINNLKSSDLSATVVPLAPRPEQERIVNAIEEQFSRLDAGVAALEQARRNLKRMRDGIRFAATRGQLVPQDPVDEPASELIARSRPTGRFRGDSPLPPDLGPLPPGWTWALMGRLAGRVTVGHVGPMKDEYVDEGIPFLRSQNVRADRFDSAGLLHITEGFHRRLAKSRLTPGDVVVVRSGNVGTACVVPESLEEANCADLVIVQGPVIEPRYVALYMNSLARAKVRAGRVGVALVHFNTQSVAELPVPVPPMAEQARIVAEADRLMSVVDSLERVTNAALRRSETTRSSILAAAFSGKLVGQDPRDEPASILIERIAREGALSNVGGKTRRRRADKGVAA